MSAPCSSSLSALCCAAFGGTNQESKAGTCCACVYTPLDSCTILRSPRQLSRSLFEPAHDSSRRHVPAAYALLTTYLILLSQRLDGTASQAANRLQKRTNRSSQADDFFQTQRSCSCCLHAAPYCRLRLPPSERLLSSSPPDGAPLCEAPGGFLLRALLPSCRRPAMQAPHGSRML